MNAKCEVSEEGELSGEAELRSEGGKISEREKRMFLRSNSWNFPELKNVIRKREPECSD